PAQLLQGAEQHFTLRVPGAEILAAVDDQERRANIRDVRDRALFIEQLACLRLPRVAAELFGDQDPCVRFAVERREIVDAALRGSGLETLVVADHPRRE